MSFRLRGVEPHFSKKFFQIFKAKFSKRKKGGDLTGSQFFKGGGGAGEKRVNFSRGVLQVLRKK